MSKHELYYGDNIEILRQLATGTVTVCYIDPPFNSKRNYNQIYNNIGAEDRAQAQAFVDTWTWDDRARVDYPAILANVAQRYNRQLIELIRSLHTVLGEGSLLAYLISIATRVVEIHRILTDDGSFYLHCDPTASHYLKLILDAIFCGGRPGEFKNEIIWQRTNAQNNQAKRFSRLHDVILLYSKTANPKWHPQFTDFSPQQLKRYKVDETGRLVTGQDLTITDVAGTGPRFNWRGAQPPPTRCWAYSRERLEEMWSAGLILVKKDGSPRLDGRKVYLDEKEGKSPGDVWTT